MEPSVLRNASPVRTGFRPGFRNTASLEVLHDGSSRSAKDFGNGIWRVGSRPTDAADELGLKSSGSQADTLSCAIQAPYLSVPEWRAIASRHVRPEAHVAEISRQSVAHRKPQDRAENRQCI